MLHVRPPVFSYFRIQLIVSLFMINSRQLNSSRTSMAYPFRSAGSWWSSCRIFLWSARRCWCLWFLSPVILIHICVSLFHCRPGTKTHHEVRFSSSFAGLASPPSQTARTPLDVYGFPLIIFTVLRMNQFMTFRAYHKSFPSPFAHKEYPLRIAL